MFSKLVCRGTAGSETKNLSANCSLTKNLNGFDL
jgi:hypothetical protein